MDSLATWLRRIGVEHPGGVLRGLDGVRRVARKLEIDAPAQTNIVVAGTNGKGSTVAFAERLLLAGGHSVGTTTSPHLHAFNERIRVMGENASDAAIVAAFEAVEAARGDVGLSYFEYAVLAALHIISAARPQYAILEVGLGGRLDAVNAVDADIAIVTSIGLDHQEYLGTTREAIGAEKAGVLRAGKPVVVGDPDPPDSVLRRAAELAAPLHLAGRDFGYASGCLWLQENEQRLTFDYPADAAIHPANAATALAALRLAGVALDPRDIGAAAVSARNPGRFEMLPRDGRIWVLDVAHNADGAAFLAAQVSARFADRRVAAVVGTLRDKDIAGIVAALTPAVVEFAFADTLGERGRSAAAMRVAVNQPQAFAGPLRAAMEHLSRADGGNDVILACGSFDVVERARIGLRAEDQPLLERSQQTC